MNWKLRFMGIEGSTTVSGGAVSAVMGKDVQMDASFVPSPGGRCPTIAFLQTVKPTTGGTFDYAPLLPTRDPTSGASADIRDATSPFYAVGAQAGGPPGLSSTMPGAVQPAGTGKGRSPTATFGDAPKWPLDSIPRGQTLSREFELAVICAESGKTFGSIRWGYTKTSAGVIALTGARPGDVQSTGASSEVEGVRQSFYTGFFAHSLSGFARGSAALTPAHRATIAQIASTGAVRRILLAGANDFSGGPEDNPGLSLARAEAVRQALQQQGVAPSLMVVEGHGSEARLPNPRGTQVPENRRVDVHLDRGIVGAKEGPQGSAREALRLRHQDPKATLQEFVDLIFRLQREPGTLPESACNQMTHLLDALERWRHFDPTVPDVRSLYGPVIRSLRARCSTGIPREPFDFKLPPLTPPSFLDPIGQPKI